MSRSSLAIILAAGEGTRMRSSLPKVMHRVAGIPMVEHVLRTSEKAGCENIAVVVGKSAELVADHVRSINSDYSIHEQTERLGTGHAVLAARTAIEAGADDVLVLYGDTPLVTDATLLRLRAELADGASVAVLGFRADDPTGYGRLLVQDGKLLAIREHKEASEDELKVDFCNGGIMGLSGDVALALLEAIDNDNAKGEYYLTDVVEIANERGLSVTAIEAPETEIMGVDNRFNLSEAEALWQTQRRREVMMSGVTMRAPETIHFHADTVVEPDVEIEPNVFFGPGVTVHSGARIRAFSHLEGATVGAGAEIGPYARLRPGAELGEKTKVGNFVEVKKAVVGEGAKINHLSYVGDANIGKGANIGAGTITCNYDGINKHLTSIGAGAFIGSNSALVAPVSIGDDAYVASGSVITEDVPDNALGIGRGKQANKDGYAKKIRAENEKHKKERTKS